MKYTKEERLDIGRKVYEREFTVDAAAVKFVLNPSSIKGYMRLYRETNHLPAKTSGRRISKTTEHAIPKEPIGIEDYEAMSKEELIDALVMAKINEARLKKGYMVKGVGAEKEFILLDSKNTK